MALNGYQQRQVRIELESHLQLAGLTELEAAADLDWSVARLQRTVQLAPGSDPVDVWRLRDYLVAAVRGAGLRPRFTVLTGANRLRARLWFRLEPAPRRGSGAWRRGQAPSQ